MDLEHSLGIVPDEAPRSRSVGAEVARIAAELTTSPPEAGNDRPCPADLRIEAYLSGLLGPSETPRLPSPALALPRHGVARALSLPEAENSHRSPILTSYRVRNGVLHNPLNDRRTTEGTFHVAEGGLPIPGDKKAVPLAVFGELLRHAASPPDDVLVVPYAARRPEPMRAFVSLLLRPVVRPEVPGVCPRASMEVRFFAPGSLVSNLDFVETIFGNAGDPRAPENDAGLDVEHWTGHTGCVILAPHLIHLTKKELGLPHWDDATDRQRRDAMCWKDESERYNDGGAFKLTCRDRQGVIVTLIADNYFGYCKKEVKTQISYAANLFGQVEEEHSGGALAFASYSLGFEFNTKIFRTSSRSLAELARTDPDAVALEPDGHAIDRHCPDLIYIPAESKASVSALTVSWTHEGRERSIPLAPGKTYMTPSGYKIRLEKHPGAASWRLIGTVAEGVSCHKPCTVSGGGKSEISKNLRDYMIYGPIFVADNQADFDLLQQLFDHDYSDRWKPEKVPPDYSARASRPLLSPDRSLGSVIRLLTPSDDYTDEYRAWLASFPDYIFPIAFIVKRFLPPDAVDRWRELFGVDVVNGFPGHELKVQGRKLVGTYLRVGLAPGGWRTFKLRQDFIAADKVQTGDDITASVVVPDRQVGPIHAEHRPAAHKFAVNCEARLFQRPDDAIHRGLDHQTEADLARADNFLSNFEPLTSGQARAIVSRVTEFDAFTRPMQRLLREAADSPTGYVVCSANPRIVDGKPSKNPRYLQTRPDLLNPVPKYIAERGMRLARGLAGADPLHVPVAAVLVGRRNNPPDPEAGIRPLAVYGPIHYQELPELFMEFICSLTGKSPSTTGAGSEGALTKGPFNALRPIHDLNAALVSYILTGLGGFSTAAGYVGPDHQVDHDISLLIPEVWCRMTPHERDPANLIDGGYLERLEDFEHDGRRVLASRLGYRVTPRFVRVFLGRVFDYPARVFDESFLRPETQGLESFVDGVHNITEAQQRVARQYFDDGSVEAACPPLRALLTIMAEGEYQGKDASDPSLRALFTPAALLASDWYRARLEARRRVDRGFWKAHVGYLDAFLNTSSDNPDAARLFPEVGRRRALAADRLQALEAAGPSLDDLLGTIGLDPALAPAD